MNQVKTVRLLLYGWLIWAVLLRPSSAQAALAELRLGPAAAMAVHVETEWPTINLFAGAGLSMPGSAGSPLRNPSLNTGFRIYTKQGTVLRPFFTGFYGLALRSNGVRPFAGGGAGLAWRFGPEGAYRLTLETDLLVRDSFVPFPTAGFGMAVRL